MCNVLRWGTRCLILFLELQETWFDLWLSILQRRGGQRGVGWQVGHGGCHLRDAACQLLPGEQGGWRGAVATRGGEVRHLHGGIVGHRDRGSGLQGGSLTRLLAFTEVRLWLHFQGGSEVEAKQGDGGLFLCWSIKLKTKMWKVRVYFPIMNRCDTHLACFIAPSTVLKSAPQSSTRQWKCTFWRKSHWASQKSSVSNLDRDRQ